MTIDYRMYDIWDDDPDDELVQNSNSNISPQFDLTRESPGTPMATMQLDRSLLPIHVDIDRRWSQYVEPQATGEELFRAYQVAVSERVSRAFSMGGWPAMSAICDTAIPEYREILCLLLETTSWEEYNETYTQIVGSRDYLAQSHIQAHGEPAVVLRADRTSILTINVSSYWAQSADPMRIGDEVLYCADEIRRKRPKLEVRGDYGMYSIEDLRYQLESHMERLISMRGVQL
ncbi:hypothetical protein IU440_10220 [Nocardia cyriacigeorgica]|uniref:hypothetical protein n=1 Tax=Nocardia cyriacigeorgica TaxID=135487 RepID=UPI00189385F0|nr:hypothetical protein [Nocardia cyriacigeorgica]MBF6425056.1 hypothetical protein [Nocardia cyriacigeorgica]